MAAFAVVVGAPAAAQPWVVVPQEPVCVLGTVFKNDVRFRLEYHPRSDSYHLTLGGKRWADATDGTPVSVRIGSWTSMRNFEGRIVRQNPELPGAVYIGLVDKVPLSRVVATSQSTTYFIEQLMARRSFLVVEVDGERVIAAPTTGSRKGISDLAHCADRFAPSKKSAASYRV